AMAYALKTDTAPVRQGQENEGAWFGYSPSHLPFEVKGVADEQKLKIAHEHLLKAIARYHEVLGLDPENLPAALGQAWCVEQSGDKHKAIAEYRHVVEAAWQKEKDIKSAGPGWHPVTAEAARYLIALLDKNKDQAEITRLQNRIERTSSVPRAVT